MSALVSVVVPVYGNASTLPELIRRIDAALDVDHEIVFVDDASPDDSASVLRALGARVITHERNRGQNAAVVTGFRHARGDVIVVLDADLQDPPEAIAELLRHKAKSGAAVAFASRTGTYAGRARMVTSRLYKRILARLAGLPRGAGLFVALDREVAVRIVEMAPVPSIVAAIGVLRVNTVAMPVARATRDGSAYSNVSRMRLACRTLAWVVTHR